jgi:vitamin K-dependent gamma-carboxylase-like protein
MTFLRAFDRYWFVPAPARRLALLRLLTGGFALIYLTSRLPSFTNVAHFGRAQFVPTGVTKLFLSEPLPSALVIGLACLAPVLAVPFVLGLFYRVTAPLFALVLLWVTTYRNSWGMIFHTENLLVMHVLVLAAAPAADALSLDARGRTPAEPSGAYGWPAHAMCWVTATCYVLAGLAKLKLAGPVWLEGGLLRAQIAYDNLRKIEFGSPYSTLGAALVHYQAPFLLLAMLTVALELGAPVALLGRRVALVWAVVAWGFHVGVEALMAIPFPYQLSFVAYAAFFEVERAFDFLRERVRRWQAQRAGKSTT